jgi:hypothetical protein
MTRPKGDGEPLSVREWSLLCEVHGTYPCPCLGVADAAHFAAMPPTGLRRLVRNLRTGQPERLLINRLRRGRRGQP